MKITFEQYKLIYDLLETKIDELRPLTYSNEKAYELFLDCVFAKISINTEMMKIEEERSRLELEKLFLI